MNSQIYVSWFGFVWLGVAGQGPAGTAWPGEVWLGMVCKAWRGKVLVKFERCRI